MRTLAHPRERSRPLTVLMIHARSLLRRLRRARPRIAAPILATLALRLARSAVRDCP